MGSSLAAFTYDMEACGINAPLHPFPCELRTENG